MTVWLEFYILPMIVGVIEDVCCIFGTLKKEKDEAMYNMLLVVMDPRWKHPFTCVIVGPTGSGNTVWVTRFLNHVSHMITPPPQEIVWCYGEWQAGYDQLSGVTFIEGLPKVEGWDTIKRRLVILDDLMSEADDRVTKLFAKGSHHRNISIMFIVQNLFGKNKEQRTISLNSHYLVVFKNARDASQMTHLAKQMYPGKLKYVQESYKDATLPPHGYLLIDLQQDTPDHLHLRTSISPSEHQVVYLQK